MEEKIRKIRRINSKVCMWEYESNGEGEVNEG